MATNPTDKLIKIDKDILDIYEMIKDINEYNKKSNTYQTELNSKITAISDQLKEESESTQKKINNVNESVAKLINQKLDELKKDNDLKIKELYKLISEASEDRKFINDTIENKNNETTNTINEKINDIKNDIVENKKLIDNNQSTFKESKADILAKIDDTNSQLKLASEENKEKREQLKQEMLLEISLNKDTVNTFKEEQTKINNSVIETFDEIKQNLVQNDENINKKVTTMETEIGESLNLVNENLNKKITTVETEIGESLNLVNDNLNKKVTTMETEIGETLNLVNENFKTQLDEQSNILKQTDEKTQNQIGKFFDVIDNHASALKSFGEITNQINNSMDQSVTDLKADQTVLMSSIQKIIMGQIENIRNELLTFSKEIRTNLNKFSDENVSSYASIQETNKLNEKLKHLDSDLNVKNEGLKKELIDNIEENMKKFDTAIKESISSVDEYRVDLERFKDDIESLIERKVNEKTEFSNELFNNLLTKSERLAQLIRDSKIESNPEIAIAIPDIKDSERKE